MTSYNLIFCFVLFSDGAVVADNNTDIAPSVLFVIPRNVYLNVDQQQVLASAGQIQGVPFSLNTSGLTFIVILRFNFSMVEFNLEQF